MADDRYRYMDWTSTIAALRHEEFMAAWWADPEGRWDAPDPQQEYLEAVPPAAWAMAIRRVDEGQVTVRGRWLMLRVVRAWERHVSDRQSQATSIGEIARCWEWMARLLSEELTGDASGRRPRL